MTAAVTASLPTTSSGPRRAGDESLPRVLVGAVVAASAAAAVLLRLPFLRVPLDPDEGGYAHLAQRWAAGERLYTDLWVDRPQGLLLLYRAAVSVAPTPAGLRVAAAVAAGGVVVATAAVAWAVAGRRSAAAAALLMAAVSVAPSMRGFTLQGEVLAAAFAVPAVAVALWWRRLDRPTGRAPLWPLAAAGALAGAAPLVKQSALDGVVVVVAVALLSGPGRSGRALLRVVAGVAVPVSAALLHAALTGWSAWWFAVVGYRTETAAGTGGGVARRLELLDESVLRVWPDLLPVVLLALLGLAATLTATRRPHRAYGHVSNGKRSIQAENVRYPTVGGGFGGGGGAEGPRRGDVGLVLLWLAAAGLGFAGGAYYHGHYWLQLLPPLVVLASFVVAPPVVGSRRRRTLSTTGAAAVAVVVGAALLRLAWLAALPAETRDARVLGPDPRPAANREVAPWVAAQTPPDATVLAYPASADLYFLAHRRAAGRYLWVGPLLSVPGAVADQAALLAGPDRPDLVALYPDGPDRTPREALARLDPTGVTAQALARHYRTVAVVAGVELLAPQ